MPPLESSQDLVKRLTTELAGLGVTGEASTAITGLLPNDGSFPTFPQVEAAHNAVMAIYLAALNAAQATGDPLAVAPVASRWSGMVGPFGFFTAVRDYVGRRKDGAQS